MPTREDLHQLVAALPDEALSAAHMALHHLQVWPPPELVELESAAEKLDQRMKLSVEKMRREHPSSGGGGGSFFVGSTDQWRGRHSSGYEDGDESVHASNIVHDDCEFTLIERIRRDRASHTVSFVIELTGPDGATARHEHRYDMS